jgi:hypothetical protein
MDPIRSKCFGFEVIDKRFRKDDFDLIWQIRSFSTLKGFILRSMNSDG